jgi:hypothetical protein
VASDAVSDLSDATQAVSCAASDPDPCGSRPRNPFDVVSLAEEPPLGEASSAGIDAPGQPRAESGYPAGGDVSPPFGPNPEAPGAAVALLTLDPAERDWWRHQHLRLRRRVNLALALAGIALAALVLLLYTQPGLGPLAMDTAPRSVGASPPDLPDPPLDPPYARPRQELTVATPVTEAAVGQPPNPPPSLRQSELELQLLRLESRLAVLEEHQLAIDRALAQIRGAALEASSADMAPPAVPAE